MKRLKILALVLALLLVVLPTAAQDDAQTPEAICEAATPAADPASRTFTEPERVLEDGVDYRAILCTGTGPVYVDLFEKQAPATVNSFVFLAQQGYYNNSIFHRVIADFMAQAGDPVGTPAGTGGPGYQFDDEPISFLTFDRPGLLAMANAGPDPATGGGTNGSQFFITTFVTDWLNYKHTIFGDVLTGYENVEAIQLCDPDCSGVTPTTLDTVVIITDPATVDADVAEDPVATVDDFVNAIAVMDESTSLPDDIVVMEDIDGGYTTEEVIAAASPNITDTLTAFFEDHSHQFRAVLALLNSSCNESYQLTSLVYTVDAYATAEDATAVLADERLTEINEAEGFERGATEAPFFTKTATDCTGVETKMGRTYLQRGRFVVAMEAILAPGSVTDEQMAQFLAGNAVSIFEQFLVTPFREVVR